MAIGAIGIVVPPPRFVDRPAMATETRHPTAVRAAEPPASPTTDTTDTTAVAASTDTTTDAATAGAPPSDVPTTATTGTTGTAGTGDGAAASTTSTTAGPPGAAEPPASIVGRVVLAEDTRDFNLIGVTLAAPPPGPVLVRTATADGAWSPWHELDIDAERALAPVPGAPVPQEPEEGAPGLHSDPLWVGDATRYELELPAASAPAAAVHLVYETTRRVAVAETAPAGADPAAPGIRARSSWGARAPAATPSVASVGLRTAVLHHTAGTNAYSSADVPSLLRGVQAYHMDANGWSDIGYNFAIDRFGRIWEARAGGVTRAVIGAHARGFNTGSTGVVVLGNFETASPSAAAVNAVAALIAWKFARHDVDPRGAVTIRAGEGSPRYAPGSLVTLNRIVGHRDVGLTVCPGRNLYPALGVIRASAASRWPRLALPGLALVGNFAGSAADDVFVRQPGVLPDLLFTASGGRLTAPRLFTVNGSYRPLVGDFDGNGFDDLLWYGPGRVPDAVWYSRGNGTFFAARAGPVNGSYRPVVGDVDGDGDDDVLWYAPGSGQEFLWLAAGSRFRSVPPAP